MLRLALSALAAACGVCLLGYLAWSVPAGWFPAGTAKQWSARSLTLPRGTGGIVDGDLIVADAGADGQVIVALMSDLRARDIGAIAWDVRNLAPDAVVKLLWRSDYTPKKVSSMLVTVESGHLLPVVVARDPEWIGNITGVALIVRGPIAKPFAIRGVTARPAGALDTLGDRIREWLAPERWNGTSINAIVGGDDLQELPLPLLLALSVTLAALATFAWLRYRHSIQVADFAALVAVMFLAAWFVLDLRWTWNLARQVNATFAQYGGRDFREKHLAAEDGPLFDFVEKARAAMPSTPVRVFVAADADFFRQRAAFHLYPHNAFALPRRNDPPPPERLKPGDYVLVWQRRGAEFDPARHRLRWDGGPPVAAELKLHGEGAALFRIE